MDDLAVQKLEGLISAVDAGMSEMMLSLQRTEEESVRMHGVLEHCLFKVRQGVLRI